MMVSALERAGDEDDDSIEQARDMLKECVNKLRVMKERIDEYKVCVCLY